MAALKGFVLVNLVCLTICVAQPWPCERWPGTVEHEAKDGTVYCCEKTTCQMGTYPVLCDTTTSTKVECRECPEGTFMGNRTPSNNHIYQCHTKRQCDESQGMKTIDEGSRDEDRKCACDLEAGYYDYDYTDNPNVAVEGGPHYCVPVECPAGKELYENGDCRKCRVGYYKEERGYGRCIEWTSCHLIDKVMIEHGDEYKNTVCADKEEVVTSVTPRIGESKDEEKDGPPYEMIFGILAGIVLLVGTFGLALYCIRKNRFTRDKDAEKQGFKGREEVASTVSSVPPYTKSPLSLDINKANKTFSKKRHGSSPDSGIADIADMKGYAPYFPSSEKLSGQNNGQNFQYARDIQEDGGSTGDEHNTSFQGEPIPEEDYPEDCKSVDTTESIPPVVNHYYYFPQSGNVNLQVGKDNKLYSGGAPAESPPTPDDYNYNGIDYNVPVHTAVHDPNYNTTKHTVV